MFHNKISRKRIWQISRTFVPAIAGCAALMILGQYLSRGFLSSTSISSILMSASILILAAIPQTLVIISGNNGIDMTVGAIMSMAALLGPSIQLQGILRLPVMLVYVAVLGAVVGLFNGIGITFFKVTPMVMTLIMSGVVNGFTLFITRGQPAIAIGPELTNVSMPILGPIRMVTVVAFSLVLIMELTLQRTRPGRTLKLVGNNANAARLNGFHINKVIVWVYCAAGAFSGLAGLLLVGYAGSAQLQMADQYTMLSIAAVVIGGTKISGGKGTFVGGILGAMILVLLTTLLQVLSMPAGIRSLSQGLLLLTILIVNNRQQKLRQ